MAGVPLIEISDLIRAPDGGGVRRDAVVDRLLASGQRRAARIVRRLPTVDGVLDPTACDALIIRVHLELQRLSEELQQGRRIAAFCDARLRGLSGRPRLVDVGCGTGHVLRWLAAHDPWQGRVEFVGVDRDAALVGVADELAATEALPVRFVMGDGFAPGVAVTDPASTVVISTGLLHHIPAVDLPAFFVAQAELGVAGFAHFDPVPGALPVLGARMFHRSRMREPVSRHDGVVSVRRAHPAAVLIDAAGRGAPDYRIGCAADRRLVLTDVLRPVWGWRG